MSFPSQVWVGNRNRISHEIVPPGGWRFQQGSIVIHSENWDKLVQDVKQHRANNKMDEGDVEKEIEEQLLILYPKLRIK